TFLSNSDCHSPHPVRLGREFNRFKIDKCNYEGIKKALNRKKGCKVVLNVGLPPQEGKYHESACSSCYTHYTLKESKRRRWRCSCGGSIKKGVKDIIAEKSDFPEGFHPGYRPEYVHLIPLSEIISKAIGHSSPFTKTVQKRWNELIDNFGSEINVLLDADIDKIRKISPPVIVDAIQAFRENKVSIIPGGGGEYGKIELPKDDEKEHLDTISTPDNFQTSISDYSK
ncbi:MAG: phosphotransferase, partial [Candidatus Thermoplasmatota archaeon]